MADKSNYKEFEQRISFLEQQLHNKDELLSRLTSNFENEIKP